MTRLSTGDLRLDPDFRLVWVSGELKTLIGEEDERKLGEAKAVAEETGLVEPEECLLNVGLRWGDHLIEQSARDGQTLTSKSLIEVLEEADARALGIDPDRVTYRMVAELPGADEKAERDAGTIPVTEL